MKSISSFRASGLAPDALQRIAIGGLLSAIAALGLAHALVGFEPLALSDWLPGCAFRSLLDIPCPGCGMTRALLLLAQLRVGESLAAHPAALPLLAVAMLWMLRPELLEPARRWRLPGLALAALLILWLSRVLPAP